MRRWFIVVLIVLLPWRAWAGDAMTLAMSAPDGAAAHCAEHTVQTVAASSAAHGDDTTHTESSATHAVCDVCNGPAMTATPGLDVDSGPLPQAHQTAGPVRFASTLPRPGHKPPIA